MIRSGRPAASVTCRPTDPNAWIGAPRTDAINRASSGSRRDVDSWMPPGGSATIQAVSVRASQYSSRPS